MARPPRDHPLQAAPRFTPPSAVVGEVLAPAPRRGDAPDQVGRSVLLGLGVGLAVLVAGVAVAFSIVAIPLYLVASTDPGNGLDRDLVRKGLVYVAIPFGGVSGLVGGLLVGIWYGRGGRLPKHRRTLYD